MCGKGSFPRATFWLARTMVFILSSFLAYLFSFKNENTLAVATTGRKKKSTKERKLEHSILLRLQDGQDLSGGEGR
jgi:hypothetical protein